MGIGAGKKGRMLGWKACGAGRPLDFQDGLGRQRYRRGKGVVVKTGDAPQAGYVLTWREDTDELICLMVIRWERRRKQLKAERRERRRKRPPKTNKP